MDHDRCKHLTGWLCSLLLVLVTVAPAANAKSTGTKTGADGEQRYIVILEDPPLAAYDGRAIHTPERKNAVTRLEPTANRLTGARKLDVHTARSQAYLKFLDERFDAVKGEAALRMGHQIKALQRYRNATNGFSTHLTADEVRKLRAAPGVKAVIPDVIRHVETDAGPDWIGAGKIHDGSAGVTPTGGQGVVVGLIDTGINWDHPSFADPGEGGGSGWDHVNPYGSQLGLCSDPEVKCNDKLVGVYDFIQDDPNTTKVEENTKGKDNKGHGTHVASTAVGNPLNLTIGGKQVSIGGVAPNANLVSYRVCYIADENDPNDDGCPTSAILQAIDQAISDQVDVINMSLGADASSPWGAGTDAQAYLNARAAGIFVATSAGNNGPNPGTVGSPANAPWVTAVGAATHDRKFVSLVENLSGGDTTPPGDLIGKSFTGGTGTKTIVYAGDYGNALCGTGNAESQPDCDGNTGASNPFAPNTFNGEIVVCDRGTYGRVEKGKNVMLAGAGGYILANTDAWGEDIVADNHCLPAAHIGAHDGDKLRAWLATGSNHQGSISGFMALHDPSFADEIASFSARGPNLPPAADVMKPDLIAPGVRILGASVPNDTSFAILDGTSMASPHIAGAAALIKAVHPDWTPSMILSALLETATPELAHDYNGSEATVNKRGAGRPRLDLAVHAGLFLDETKDNFTRANPQFNGEPRNLNLPGLVDTQCVNSCTFQRTVTDMAGGASWSASAEGLPPDVTVSLSPQNFSLADTASRLLTITVDLTQADLTGSWVYGDVRLQSSGMPDAVLPLAVYASGGVLPDEWQIDTDQVSGWQQFAVDGLVALPDATFTSGGLVVPDETTRDLAQDPTEDDPFDDNTGVMTVWYSVPAGALWLHAETLASTANDLDLYVGRDSNHDGKAQKSEQLCSSTTPEDLELCDLFSPVAGDYWVLVQNWDATNDPDTVTLKSAVVGPQTDSPLSATGPGIVPAGGSFDVRVAWENVNVPVGTGMLGAVGVGTDRNNPGSIGVVPVKFTRSGVEAPQTTVLMNGLSRTIAVDAGQSHDRVFVDVPPGANSLAITSSGADEQQSDNLEIELYRMDFDNAFGDSPFAAPASTGGGPVASASGGSGNGPALNVGSSQLQPGRWYVVVTNNGASAATVTLEADIVFSGQPIALHGGLWQPSIRTDLHQGYDYNTTGSARGFLWYSFNEDGEPEWYLASGPEPDGNTWVAELFRYTNDGSEQHGVHVGYVSITTVAENDEIFSFLLFGKNGSDRMEPSSFLTCPTVDNVKRSYTGLWSRARAGIGGASTLVNDFAQAYVHYIYDAQGNPRWMTSSSGLQLPASGDMPLLQFTGYCAVCADTGTSYETVGTLNVVFSDESDLAWTLDYTLRPPLSGSIERSNDAVKLTAPLACQ
ncbi:MAG: S8 family serine peptidase [Lysobacterales bacterium]|jgi:subtilisin family serine protease